MAVDELITGIDDSCSDYLIRARAIALSLAVDVARDRGKLTRDHPGADAILTTAREYFDFIWSGK